jgi:hypothetical protein
MSKLLAPRRTLYIDASGEGNEERSTHLPEVEDRRRRRAAVDDETWLMTARVRISRRGGGAQGRKR